MVFIRPEVCPKSSELLECLSEHLVLHTYGLDKTRMPERQLHHLLYLSKLLLASSNIILASSNISWVSLYNFALHGSHPSTHCEISPLYIGWQISRK